ncbi:MAG: Cna B-type domain-containing protein [Blautia sp.]|jgi:hypothetical protein
MAVKINKFLRWFGGILGVLFLWIFCLGTEVLASGVIDVDRETSLTLYFGGDGNGFSDVEFRIYRVADISEKGEFTLTEDYADYAVSLAGLDSSGWRALAQTLDAYIARDGLGPLQTKATDSSGQAIFENLPTGLYLVEGECCRQNGYSYNPEPCLVSLPGLDQESNEWTYEENISCKYQREDSPDLDQDSIERKVLKVWKDDGKEAKRPEEISVQLLRDGAVYDTVTLSADNDWRYTWRDLDSKSQWQMTEYETPKNYTVSVNQEGITFVMTNTYQTVTDTPEDTTTGSNTSTGQNKLPQTGMLWWPVPVLACGGMLLILLGWRKLRHEEK